ncbi:hypothetical protein A0H81_01190 [Grifola frondosa]|uniref:Uncharacterized protein n=1 Tax=Grifola frondosa TaxID=5627 RepID=A0A1C7MWQ3_GRIFR|nr:hypothetical protein A0H81_01190 [Grifola frondosa]
MSNTNLPAQSDARFDTSASWAAAEASDAKLTKEVEQNASQLHNVAEDAAATAQYKESVPAVDHLERGLSHKTNVAASEGQYDVESAKATVGGYVEQAKNIANSAFATAQSYLPGSQTQNPSRSIQYNNTAESLTAAVKSGIATGKEYLASAQATAQPHIDHARTVVQPHLDRAVGAVSGTASGNSGVDSSAPSKVPASTAPLESGPQVVGNPYPATTTGQSVNVAEV